jgi:hypothetical protein
MNVPKDCWLWSPAKSNDNGWESFVADDPAILFMTRAFPAKKSFSAARFSKQYCAPIAAMPNMTSIGWSSRRQVGTCINGICRWKPPKKDLIYLVNECRDGSRNAGSMTCSDKLMACSSLLRCSSVTSKRLASGSTARGSSLVSIGSSSSGVVTYSIYYRRCLLSCLWKELMATTN